MPVQDIEFESQNVRSEVQEPQRWSLFGDDGDHPPRSRKEYLDTLWQRDPDCLWPVPRVFLPVWTEAGVVQQVLRVNDEDIPDTPFVDGVQAPGEQVDEIDIHHGTLHPVSTTFFEAKLAQPLAGVKRETKKPTKQERSESTFPTQGRQSTRMNPAARQSQRSVAQAKAPDAAPSAGAPSAGAPSGGAPSGGAPQEVVIPRATEAASEAPPADA